MLGAGEEVTDSPSRMPEGIAPKEGMTVVVEQNRTAFPTLGD